jgi:hypothetical protein
VRFNVPNGVSTTSPRLTASIMQSTIVHHAGGLAAAEAFGGQLVDHRGFETAFGLCARLLFASPGAGGLVLVAPGLSYFFFMALFAPPAPYRSDARPH